MCKRSKRSYHSFRFNMRIGNKEHASQSGDPVSGVVCRLSAHAVSCATLCVCGLWSVECHTFHSDL